jgi:hypothetical protein
LAWQFDSLYHILSSPKAWPNYKYCAGCQDVFPIQTFRHPWMLFQKCFKRFLHYFTIVLYNCWCDMLATAGPGVGVNLIWLLQLGEVFGDWG